jgi:hypothetical protein
MLPPRNYEGVTGDAIRFAQAAMINGWLFDEYIKVAREAWVIQHENALRQAKYQVEKDS